MKFLFFLKNINNDSEEEQSGGNLDQDDEDDDGNDTSPSSTESGKFTFPGRMIRSVYGT